MLMNMDLLVPRQDQLSLSGTVELQRLLLATQNGGAAAVVAVREMEQRLSCLVPNNTSLTGACSSRRLRNTLAGSMLIVQAARLWLTGVPRSIGRGHCDFGEYLHTLPVPEDWVTEDDFSSLVLVDTRLPVRSLLSAVGGTDKGMFKERDCVDPDWATLEHPTEGVYWIRYDMFRGAAGSTLSAWAHDAMMGWRPSRLPQLVAALVQGRVPVNYSYVYAPASFVYEMGDTGPKMMVYLNRQSGVWQTGSHSSQAKHAARYVMRDQTPLNRITLEEDRQ